MRRLKVKTLEFHLQKRDNQSQLLGIKQTNRNEYEYEYTQKWG